MNLYNKKLKTIIILVYSLLGLTFIFYMIGTKINTTKSIPLGIYIKDKAVYKKGDYVIFCPPENDFMKEARSRGYIGKGFCPGEYGKMMKQVVAIEGDIVSFSDKGISVNQKNLAFSEPKKIDMHGRILSHFQYQTIKLHINEVLLMTNNNELSFDGRYFGPINIRQIESVIRSLWTW